MMKLETPVEVADLFEGQRVRVIWHSKAKRWFVYAFAEDVNEIICTTKGLALTHAAVYGELKPKFAPNGAPSFVGTVTRYALQDDDATRRVLPHPYAPSKLYFDDGEEAVEEFNYAKRAYLDGSNMLVSTK